MSGDRVGARFQALGRQLGAYCHDGSTDMGGVPRGLDFGRVLRLTTASQLPAL